MKFNITPVPAPRMTRSDKWKKRDCVMRYFAFRDEVALNKIQIPEMGCHIIFTLPMPDSWKPKKKAKYEFKPHQQKPDIDNLLKALLDAVTKNDTGFWNIQVSKYWGYKGSIEIK